MSVKNSEHFRRIDEEIVSTMWKPGKLYWLTLLFFFLLFLWGFAVYVYLLKKGLGVTGLNYTVNWGVFIASFVYWIGLSHSGTLLSAILLIFRAKWRVAFNRTSEAMTVFTVMTGGLFPIIHAGRPWKIYWLFPYDYGREVWPNFKSALVWDVFAIVSYLTVSIIFLYVGMIPDLAVVSKYSTGLKKKIYSFLSLGWKGTHKQWQNYNRAVLFLAAIVTPLAVSVHSVVSTDFAISVMPGWHSTLFPPYFVAGAIFSGISLIILLTVPVRHFMGLHKYITVDDFERLAKLLLAVSLVMTYAYTVEYAIPFYTENEVEKYQYVHRLVGDFAPFFWTMVVCNCVVPLFLFIRKLRRSIPFLMFCSFLVQVGMYLERYILTIATLEREYTPYAWTDYIPSFVEISIFLGSIGWFMMLFLVFVKLFPPIAIAELKEAGR